MYKDVVWLSLTDAPARGYWDQAMLEDMFKTKEHHTEIGELKQAIVVIPTADQNPDDINKELSKLDECYVICTSDEWHNFDLSKLSHANMELFSMYATDDEIDVMWLPIGYTPHGKAEFYSTERDNDIYFAGQVNHKKRKEMVKELNKLPNFKLDQSGGFAQGLNTTQYLHNIKTSKVISAPSGNISPDSFRLYEALENGAVPIADDPKYFTKLFGSYPFPAVNKSEQWSTYAEESVKLYPVLNNRCSAWWQSFKCNLYMLFNPPTDRDMTVVIPVSPIKSHPSTEILAKTIASVRHHTDAEIIVTFDGVREEQEHMRADYNKFINNFLSSCPDRVRPIIFDEHLHQTGMMNAIIHLIMTPLVMYVEQDTPLVIDREIDWEACKDKLLANKANSIRFHYHNIIRKSQRQLMLDKEPDGLFRRTYQWSQRPHLARTDFYKRILKDHFSFGAKCFIEDEMYKVCENAYLEEGFNGWKKFKLHIYQPKGNIKRSYHLDGRDGEEKFEDKQVF